MLILAVDTSTAAASIALIKDGNLLCEYTLNHKKNHSQKLMTAVDEVLKSTNIAPDDIDGFACSEGPGSFTGLRIGAATIKGMAQTVKKPVIGVPTLDALAYNVYNKNGYICPILDAQRGAVYSALYKWTDKKLSKEKDFRAIQFEELIWHLKRIGENVTFIGDAVPMYYEIINGLDWAFAVPANIMLPRASSVGMLAEELYRAGKYTDYSSFKPFYIRKSQAETEYEKRQKVEILPMSLEDIEQVHEIEKLSFKTPWSYDAFREELTNNACAKYIVAKVDGQVVGYGGMWAVLDEGHITNIAVHPDFRGQKIGEKLVSGLIELALKTGINSITLEVRPSNEAARNLYNKFGFEEYGMRKRYYQDTGEDAIIMWKKIG